MKQAAERLRDSVLDDGGGGTHQGKFQRDVFVQAALERLDHLDIGRAALVFGRIDRASSDVFYIGRRAVSGPNKEAVVVDWRAPAAAPFYRATAIDHQDITLRRHLACDGPRLVSIEDEHFSDDPATAETGLAGSGALMSALGAARTGYMRDIVATVQREQDEIIRADMPGVLGVQGGPGTGKTAVALHRAAYLLFTYRNQIGSEGLLFIGPNRLFLRYISRVLPALGESGAILSTPEGLVSGARVTAKDLPAVEKVKGDGRMSQVLRAALSHIEAPLSSDLVLKVDGKELRLGRSAAESAMRAVQRSARPHNRARPHLERLIAGRLHRQLVRAAGKVRDRVTITKSDMASWLADDPAYLAALDRMWPVISADEFVSRLLGSREMIEKACAGHLNRDEIAALAAAAEEREGWTRADLPLIDESRDLLGPLPVAKTDDQDEEDDEEELIDETRTYRHIVVDEVQDLSAMQLRMLTRRSSNGSMTVVGDLAQTTRPGATGSWEELLGYLPRLHTPRLMELSINYRTPKAIMDLAARLLPVAAPTVAPSRSIRETEAVPSITRTTPDDLIDAAVKEASRLSEMVEGNVAVIAPARHEGRVLDALKVAVATAKHASEGLDSRFIVAGIDDAKGLEFDAVVLVDPASVLDEGYDLRALYVALTRATQRLAIVHAQDLPPELA